MSKILLSLALSFIVYSNSVASGIDEWQQLNLGLNPSEIYVNELKKTLLDQIKNQVKGNSASTGVDYLSENVINAFISVDRADFVDDQYLNEAYENHPLSIGEGQTISQPFIVAIMTELLKLQPTDTVLEIGTGSGYQAAILSRLVKNVYTIEIFKSLADKAKERFNRLNYTNIQVFCGDGGKGWPKAEWIEPGEVLFDKIISTAASKGIPEDLIRQLKPNGIMVAPLEEESGYQNLYVITKDFDNNITKKKVLSVRFVPFINAS